MDPAEGNRCAGSRCRARSRIAITPSGRSGFLARAEGIRPPTTCSRISAVLRPRKSRSPVSIS